MFLNHTFIHRFKTGTFIKIEVQRDGINSPKFTCSEETRDFNEFERYEYQDVVTCVIDTLIGEYTDSEYQSMVKDGLAKLNLVKGDDWLY